MSKNGFSYYKAETDRFQDIKIKRLKKKYGCDGYAVYQYALNGNLPCRRFVYPLDRRSAFRLCRLLGHERGTGERDCRLLR